MTELDHATLAALKRQVGTALEEDIGPGDLTAALIDPGARLSAQVVCRGPAVLCGQRWLEEVFRTLDPEVRADWRHQDGDAVAAGSVLCELHGAARALLSGERTALNFVQLLSASATATRRYVAAVAGTGATILDTRKTLPGLRLAQKYAVRCGGGSNHRIGLFDGVLIKENHIAAAGSIAAALRAAAAQQGRAAFIEVEVENLDQLAEALASGAERVLLDNFSLDDMRRAVQQTGSRAGLEASGGVTLETIRAIAETGVHFISVGSLTKDIDAIDLSMRWR